MKKRLGLFSFVFISSSDAVVLWQRCTVHITMGQNNLFPGGKRSHVVVILLQLRIDWFGTNEAILL